MAIADTLRSANGAQTVDSQKPDSELFSALMQRPVGFTSQDSPTSKDILSPALYDPLTHPEAIAQQKPYFEQAIKDASDNFDPKEVQAKTLRGAITGVDRKVSEGQQARADAIRGPNKLKERLGAPFRQEQVPADLRPGIQKDQPATLAQPVDQVPALVGTRLAKGQPTTDLYKAALEKPALAAAIRLKSDGLDDRLSQNSVTMKEPGRAVGVATDQMDAASAIFGNKPVQPRGPDFPKNLPETPKADDMSKQTWNLKWVPARTGIVEKNATITPDPEAKWEEMDNTLKRILARDYQGGNAFTPSAGIHAASVRDQLQSQSKIIDLRDGQRFGLPGTQGVTTG